jgi:hypothetical protein
VAPDEVTDRYRAALAGTRTGVLSGLSQWWGQLDPHELDRAFAASSPAAVQLVAAGQARSAGLGPRYLEAFLGASGATDTERQPLAAAAFAGRSVDGRPLTDALYSGVVEVKRRVALGQDLTEARAAGFARITRAVSTELGDTARESLTGSMVLDPHVEGYRRAVRLPACGRCLQLAGKVYRVEAAFLRHPRCDCVNEPHLGGKLDEPEDLFARMSPAEQDAAVGKADAELVRSGERTVSQVVNARAATNKAKGLAAPLPAAQLGRRTVGAKPTPLALRLTAKGDPDRYRELMDAEGYLLRRVVRTPRRPAPVVDLDTLDDDRLADLLGAAYEAEDYARADRIAAVLDARDEARTAAARALPRSPQDLDDLELSRALSRAYEEEDLDLARQLGAEADRRDAARGVGPEWDEHTGKAADPVDWQALDRATDAYWAELGVKVDSAADAARSAAKAEATRREPQGRQRDRIAADYVEYVERAVYDAHRDVGVHLLRPDKLAEFQRKGYRIHDLFSGPARVAHYYASEELLNYWRTTPRLTLSQYARAAGDRSRSTLDKAAKADGAFQDGYARDRRKRR